MKKTLLFTIVGLFTLTMASTSCNKCQDCSILGFTEEVCQDDFASKDDYKKAIEEAEAWGATCK